MFNKVAMLLGAGKKTDDGVFTVTVGKWEDDYYDGTCYGYSKGNGAGAISSTKFDGGVISEVQLKMEVASSGSGAPEPGSDSGPLIVVKFSEVPSSIAEPLLLTVGDMTYPLYDNGATGGQLFGNGWVGYVDCAEGDVIEFTLAWGCA